MTLTVTSVAVIVLPTPVARSPVSPPPPWTETLPPVSATWPPEAALAPTSLPPLPTRMVTPVVVIVLLVPVANRPVFPPPPEKAISLPPLS